MRRSFAIAAVAVVIGVGSGTAVGVARSGSTPSSQVSGAPSTTVPKSGANDHGKRHAHGGRLERVLADLVAKGTITQSQADAITKAMNEARPEGRQGPHGDGFGFFRSAEKVNTAVANLLGVTPTQLRDERRAGKSLAQIGKEHGVAAQRLVDVIVQTISVSIDEAVAKGDLTAQQASRTKAHLSEFVTKLVNSTRGSGGMRPPRDQGQN